MSTNPFVSYYEPLYGSLYFASVLATAFYSITCMQTFFYFVHYRNDPLLIKIFVVTMWTLNTIHEAVSISGVYKYILAGLGSPIAFLFAKPEFIVLYLLTALVAVPTQGFFVYRIYIFSKKNIIVPLIWVILAVAQIVSAIVYMARVLYEANGVVKVVAYTILDSNSATLLATLCYATSAVIDIVITIFMTYLLIRERAATGFASTAHILQRLTVYSVNTGTWTALFALLSVIFLHAFPLTLIYTVFALPICSIYCNTLLANLNARAYLWGNETTLEVHSSFRVADNNEANSREHVDSKILVDPSAPQGPWKTPEVDTLPNVREHV